MLQRPALRAGACVREMYTRALCARGCRNWHFSTRSSPPLNLSLPYRVCVYIGHWYSVMSWQYIRGMDCGLVSHVPCVLWVCCLVWHPVSLVLRSTLCLSCLSAPTGPSFLRDRRVTLVLCRSCAVVRRGGWRVAARAQPAHEDFNRQCAGRFRGRLRWLGEADEGSTPIDNEWSTPNSTSRGINTHEQSG